MFSCYAKPAAKATVYTQTDAPADDEKSVSVNAVIIHHADIKQAAFMTALEKIELTLQQSRDQYLKYQPILRQTLENIKKGSLDFPSELDEVEMSTLNAELQAFEKQFAEMDQKSFSANTLARTKNVIFYSAQFTKELQDMMQRIMSDVHSAAAGFFGRR